MKGVIETVRQRREEVTIGRIGRREWVGEVVSKGKEGSD